MKIVFDLDGTLTDFNLFRLTIISLTVPIWGEKENVLDGYEE